MSVIKRHGLVAARRRAIDAPAGGVGRRVRPERSTRLLRGPTQAVMATRQALEPDQAPGQAPARPQPEELVQAAVAPHIDTFLLSTVVCLLMLGTVFIYSASMYQSYLNQQGVNFYLIRQVAGLIMGSVALLIGLRFDYRNLRRISMAGVGCTAVLLLLIHVSKLSIRENGAARWIHLGPLILQPSEIGKLALTIYAAHWLSSKGEDVKHSVQGLVPFGVVLGLTTLLVFSQPDVGTSAIITLSMLAMFFVSGARLRHLLMVAALFIPVVYYVTHHAGYMSARIAIWRHPFADLHGDGYQISHALLAFWHGGLTGTGLGNGQLKESIPFPMNDTIYATIGEETGLLGALAVLALFAYFAYRGIRIGMLVKDPFGKLLACGITCYLVVQALLNMASVTNLIPFTGVPLPFISYGNSSLVVNLLAVGILLNISRHVEPVPEERPELAGTYLWWRNRRPYLSLSERGAQPGRRQGPRRRLGSRA